MPLSSEGSGFAHVQQAACAKRKVTKKKSGQEQSGTRHYLSSLSPAQASPAKMARLVRGHWTVENNIHWLRDMVGGEDRCRSRDPNAACALALLRTALLAPVRPADHKSLTEATETFAHDPAAALRLLTNQRLA